MNNYASLKVGFIGFGEVNTPRELIERKCLNAKNLLVDKGFDLVDAGIVTDDINRSDSALALENLKGKDMDALVLCVAGWIPSYVVIRIADHFKSLPMILWGLCGQYEGDKLITTAEQAGTSALRKPMSDLGFTFKYVYDTTDGIQGVDGLCDYLSIVKTAKFLMTAKIAMIGYRDMNLYGTMFDGIKLKKKTGMEIEFFEMLQMLQGVENIKEEDALNYLDKIKREWTFTKPAEDKVLLTGIKYFLSLKEIISKHGYEAFSIIDVDGMKKLLGYPPSLILMLVANELNICTIPENDALGSATQLICKQLTGQISAYFEFYEYMKDRVLMGVPDYIPHESADGEYLVTPTKFGLLGECILNVSKVRSGTVTLARLFPQGDTYGMHITLANSCPARKWEEAGWTPPAPQLPSLEIILGNRTEHFVNNIMGQHYILTYGDNIKLLSDYCHYSGIDVLIS